MPIVKKLTRGLCASLLKFSLFALALTAAISMAFGTPAQLKQSLKASGIYSTIVDNVIDSTKKDAQQKEGEDSIPLDQPEIQAAAKTAFPPEYLQSTFEQVIDGTYHWLDGKTPQPDFSIDLTPAKQRLSEALGDYAVKRAQSLPACTLQQARQLQVDGIDPLNIPCVPRGFNVASLKPEVVNKMNSNQDFLKDPVITANTLSKNEEGQTPFQKLDQAPKAFGLLKKAPYILGGLTLVSGVALFFLHDERRRGIRQISIIVLATGIFLFLSTFVVNYLLSKVKGPGGPVSQISDTNFQHTMSFLVQSLTAAINRTLLIFGGVYTVLGAGGLVALRFTGPKHPKVEKSEDPLTPATTPPSEAQTSPETETVTTYKTTKN